MAMALVSVVLGPMTNDAHARDVFWAGSVGGFWDENDNWLPLILPEGYHLQPFDNDDVSIPAGGLPTIRFLEGISTLDVEATAGITNNSVLTVHNGAVNDGAITLGADGQLLIEFGNLSGSGEVVLTPSRSVVPNLGPSDELIVIGSVG